MTSSGNSCVSFRGHTHKSSTKKSEKREAVRGILQDNGLEKQVSSRLHTDLLNVRRLEKEKGSNHMWLRVVTIKCDIQLKKTMCEKWRWREVSAHFMTTKYVKYWRCVKFGLHHRSLNERDSQEARDTHLDQRRRAKEKYGTRSTMARKIGIYNNDLDGFLQEN